MHRFAIVVFLMVLFCAVASSFSATIHVPSQQPTIQAGINAAVNGDMVLVAPGTYNERFSFNGKDVVVKSSLGPLLTKVIGAISNSPSDPTVLFSGSESADAILEGFTFEGGPIAIRSSPGSAPTIRRNILIDQTYPSWAAAVIEGPAKFSNNTICFGANGGIATYSSSTIVENNIIAFNANYGIATGSGTPVLAFNDVFGNGANYLNLADPGFPSFGLNPLFVDASLRDFRLLPNSPCVDAGNPDPAYNDPDGTRNDIGAYPLSGLAGTNYPVCFSLTVSPKLSGAHTSSLTPDVVWAFLDTGGVIQSAYEIEVGTNDEWSTAEMWATGQVNDSSTSVLYSGAPLQDKEQYFLRCRVSDGTSWSEWAGISFVVWLPRTLSVPSDFTTIQMAIDSASEGDTVLVAPGEYIENLIVQGKAITLTSSGGPEITVIRGQGSELATIQITNTQITRAEISGFTITGGVDGGISCSNASLAVLGNIITGNSHEGNAGGGISLNSTFGSLISGNRIFGNTGSGYGSAIHVGGDGSGSLSDTICYNLMYDNQGIGDIRLLGSVNNLQVYNNTIRVITYGGIAKQSTGSINIRNNIIFGAPVYAFHGEMTVEYNCLFDNLVNYANGCVPGSGNVTQDALFKDIATKDYSLQVGSPCINSGDPNPVYNDADGSRNDMGAIPYFPLVAPPILAPIGPKSVSEGVLLSFNVSATDANGTTPSLEAPALASGATFFDSTNGRGNFSWTPTYAQAGEYDIMFIASDGELADSELVHITVQNVIRPPVIDSFAIDGSFAYQNLLNATPEFGWRYTDPEAIGQDSFLIAVGTDNNWQFAEKWNPAPFASADTFVTYDGSALQDGQTYYIRLRVHNTLAWSDWYQTSFRMNSVPTSPILRAPTNLAVVGSTPTLWVTNGTDAESDPLTYEFAGFHDTDCVAGPAIDLIGVASGVDSTGGQIVDPLAENCRYWWRARAFDGYEYSAWTSYAQFMVNGTPEAPATPSLDYPPLPDNKPIFTLLPTLSWQVSHDPDPGDTVRYKLELSDRANFSFALVRDSLLDVNLPLVDSLVFGTHYYWRVTAKDKSGLSAMSGVKEFWTWKLGDMNHSHSTDLSDLSLLIAYLTQTPRPDISPKMVADLTGDCRIDLSDLSTMVAFMTTTGVVLQVGCE